MRRKRRVEITIETSRLVVRRSSQRLTWCARCATRVQSVTLQDAAALIGVETSSLCTQIEAGEYHFLEEARSGPICLNSLFVSIDKQNHD